MARRVLTNIIGIETQSFGVIKTEPQSRWEVLTTGTSVRDIATPSLEILT